MIYNVIYVYYKILLNKLMGIYWKLIFFHLIFLHFERNYFKLGTHYSKILRIYTEQNSCILLSSRLLYFTHIELVESCKSQQFVQKNSIVTTCRQKWRKYNTRKMTKYFQLLGPIHWIFPFFSRFLFIFFSYQPCSMEIVRHERGFIFISFFMLNNNQEIWQGIAPAKKWML